ncbi:MAG: hypothetical protein ACP5UP_08400 [Athalassotoga sp.]|uniref:hypothetical protein n=1 Tax=Athalassotoga sp. TaxID=2022597 RepID=UPI003D053AA0
MKIKHLKISLRSISFTEGDVMFSFETDSHSRKQMRLMSLSNLWNSMINEKMILNTYEDPISLLKKR